MLLGAKALALPTKFGQNLIIEKGENNLIEWKSYDANGSIWYNDTFSFEEIIKKKITVENTIRNTLIGILHQAYLLNNIFLEKNKGYRISTQLTFPKDWGLGTSSTLLSNLSQWLSINAYQLLKHSFGGSGYDIACATHNTPIIYQLIEEKQIITPIDFNPPFLENIYFIYLNKKQSSKKEISYFLNKINNTQPFIEEINIITTTICSTKNFNEFCFLLEKHELLLSNLLEKITIKEILFPDFNGVIKSLGAWGGDFIMAVSNENPAEYFKEKGFSTILSYKDMILFP